MARHRRLCSILPSRCLTSLFSVRKIRRTPQRTVIYIIERVCLAARAAWWGVCDQLFGTGPLFDSLAPCTTAPVVTLSAHSRNLSLIRTIMSNYLRANALILLTTRPTARVTLARCAQNTIYGGSFAEDGRGAPLAGGLGFDLDGLGLGLDLGTSAGQREQQRAGDLDAQG